ncbi:hypothetical protein REC12_13875 [Desulfosporosinus sp. PR]|nr:hypothetical protein [Desulfosporosinus sp. PR]
MVTFHQFIISGPETGTHEEPPPSLHIDSNNIDIIAIDITTIDITTIDIITIDIFNINTFPQLFKFRGCIFFYSQYRLVPLQKQDNDKGMLQSKLLTAIILCNENPAFCSCPPVPSHCRAGAVPLSGGG